jgi:hypothetical protein
MQRRSFSDESVPTAQLGVQSAADVPAAEEEDDIVSVN